MNLLDLLKTNALLNCLTQEDLCDFCKICSIVTLQKNKFVFFDGDFAKAIYLLVSGSVKIFKNSYDGNERILKIIRPNEVFAESAIFGSGHYPANAYTIDDSILIKICNQQLVKFLTKTPELSIRLLNIQSNRLREFTQKIELLSSRNLFERFIEFCQKYSDQSSNNIIVKINTIQLLADELGTTRESLSRLITKLSKTGIVQKNGKTLIINKCNL